MDDIVRRGDGSFGTHAGDSGPLHSEDISMSARSRPTGAPEGGAMECTLASVMRSTIITKFIMVRFRPVILALPHVCCGRLNS
eukprot:SAG11_NODE_1916_length_4071_cov_3.418429_2_plen_83_part_00